MRIISRAFLPFMALLSLSQGQCLCDEWLRIDSAYFAVYHRPGADLKKIERHLRSRQVFTRRYIKPDPLSPLEEKIAYDLDTLFERTKEILDMNPGAFHADVKIHRDRNALADEYYGLFRTESDIKAFHVHKYNTIYTDEDDASDSVMAHEMAHAIVDRYFVVRPPEKINEMLAQYVDVHLDEE